MLDGVDIQSDTEVAALLRAFCRYDQVRIIRLWKPKPVSIQQRLQDKPEPLNQALTKS